LEEFQSINQIPNQWKPFSNSKDEESRVLRDGWKIAKIAPVVMVRAVRIKREMVTLWLRIRQCLA